MTRAIGPVQQSVESKLSERFHPVHLEVLNESHLHNVPAGSEYHFKVVVVSNEFSDKTSLARHRAVNSLLAEELNAGVHALTISTFTPEEWKARSGEVSASPKCRGGMSREG